VSRTDSKLSASGAIVQEAVVESLTTEGSYIVRIGENLFTLTLSGKSSLVQGDKIAVAIMRLPDGSMSLEMLPAPDLKSLEIFSSSSKVIGEKVNINALRMLLSSLDLSIDKLLPSKEIVQLKEAIRQYKENQNKEEPVINNLRKVLITAFSVPELPKEVSSNIVKLMQHLKTMELNSPGKAEVRPVITIPPEVHLPVKPVAGNPLSAVVTDVRVDGRVMVSIERSKPIPIPVPIPVKSGDKFLFVPLNERSWTIADYVPLVIEKSKENFSTIRVMMEKVLSEPQFIGRREEIPESELLHIEKAVDAAVRAWTLPEDDAESMVRILFKLSESHSVRDRIRPELTQFMSVKNVGDNILRLVSLLSSSGKEFTPFVEQVENLLEPLLETEENTEKAPALLKKLEERSGLQFEHKLMRLLSSAAPEKVSLLSNIKNDFKGQLVALLEMASKADVPSTIKEQIKSEVGVLLNQIDALQVKNSSDDNWRHIFIPIVQEGEPRSAQVSFKRRGKRGAVDPENNSVVIRVAPSRIGEMEAAAKVHNGNLSVKFRVAADGLLPQFDAEKALLKERLNDLGYNVVSLDTEIWKRGLSKNSSAALSTSLHGFDITV
jgi:hypothetical protein